MSRKRLDCILVIAVCVVAFFWGLGRAPVARIQEARVLETAREMLENRDFILPRMEGQPRLQKPPLSYWLAAAGFVLAGDTTESAGRLYSATAGSLTVLLLLGYGYLAGRPRAGFWAALILATSRLWLRHSRLAETDVLLTLATTAALLALFSAFDTPSSAHRRLWILAGWAAMAVGCMAKGPAGLLPLAPAIVCGVVHRGRRSLNVVFYPLGPLLFLAIVTPWLVLVTLRHNLAPGAFWNETLVVATGTLHGKPVLYSLVYYLLRIWPDFGPWSLLLPFAAAAAIRAFRTDSLARFSVLWIAVMLCELEVVGSRQPHYLLPLMPGLALLTGWWLAERSVPLWRRVVAWLLPLPVAISLFLAFGGDRKVQPEHFARKDFALRIRPTVEDHPLSFFDQSDPILCFYLKRTIPAVTVEDLRRQIASRQSVFVLATIDSPLSRASLQEAIAGHEAELVASQKLDEHESIFLYRVSRTRITPS